MAGKNLDPDQKKKKKETNKKVTTVKPDIRNKVQDEIGKQKEIYKKAEKANDYKKMASANAEANRLRQTINQKSQNATKAIAMNKQKVKSYGSVNANTGRPSLPLPTKENPTPITSVKKKKPQGVYQDFNANTGKAYSTSKPLITVDASKKALKNIQDRLIDSNKQQHPSVRRVNMIPMQQKKVKVEEEQKKEKKEKNKKSLTERLIASNKEYFPGQGGMGRMPTEKQKAIKTERVNRDLKDSAFVRLNAGLFEGLSPIDLERFYDPNIDQSFKDTTSFKIGEGLGEELQSAIVSGGVGGIAVKGVSKIAPKMIPKATSAAAKALSKTWPKMGEEAAKRVGGNIVESTVKDLAIGLPLNINQAYGKDGLRGTDALKDVVINTATDIGMDGAQEVALDFMKQKKRLRTQADQVKRIGIDLYDYQKKKSLSKKFQLEKASKQLLDDMQNSIAGNIKKYNVGTKADELRLMLQIMEMQRRKYSGK